MPTKMAVCGKNSNGIPDIFFCLFEGTEDEYNDGTHYKIAEEAASNNGYEGPFVTFDEEDNKTIMSLFLWESISKEDILFDGVEFQHIEVGSSFYRIIKGKEIVQMKIEPVAYQVETMKIKFNNVVDSDGVLGYAHQFETMKIKFNVVDSDGVLGYISNSKTRVKVIKTIALTK